mgnify:CR=1 FL=1
MPFSPFSKDVSDCQPADPDLHNNTRHGSKSPGIFGDLKVYNQFELKKVVIKGTRVWRGSSVGYEEMDESSVSQM